MTPFECYCLFTAIKRHFAPASTYDYHKYRGKLNLRAATFDTSPARFHFDRLSKHRDVEGYCVANLIHTPKVWVGDLLTPIAEQNYIEHMNIRESMSYFMKKQLTQFTDINTAFIFTDEDAPAYEAMMAGSLSLEVLAVIDTLVQFTNHWEKKRGWEPTVRGAVHVIRKLKNFVPFDPVKITKLLKEFAQTEAA